MKMKSLEAGPYSDPSAAHERANKLKSNGAKNIEIRKTKLGWVILYTVVEGISL